MNKLTELANKYKSDKGTSFDAGNVFVHGFTKVYNTYFKQFEGQHPVILEIGVFRGSSIKMINEYYNGDCEIYCFDIDENCKSYIDDLGDNVHFYVINQGDPKALMNFVGEMNSKRITFNMIIDDGSHALYHQILSMLCLYKLVDINGYYIIEDCHTSYDLPQYDCYKYGRTGQLNKHNSILEMLTYFYNPIGDFDNEIHQLLKSIKYVLTYNNTEQINKILNATSYKELQENRSITCIVKFINKGEA